MTGSPASATERVARNREIIAGIVERCAEPRFAPAIERHAGALAVPSTRLASLQDRAIAAEYGLPRRGLKVLDGGIYDADGLIIASAAHLNGTNRLHLPSTEPLPPGAAEPAPQDGRWLFAGCLFRHFGHFLTESLARLWAWPRFRGRVAGIAWLMQPAPAGTIERQGAALLQRGFVRDLFELLGIEARHLVVGAPTRFAELIVPAQLAMNAPDGRIAGHPAYRRFLRGIAPEGPAPSRSVYVSRAGLEGAGRFFAEDRLEEAFRAAGWEVLRPETAPVREQLAVYGAARRLVFAEGSALHLYAPAARPGQQIAVLCRRPGTEAKFRLQIKAFGGGEVAALDAVRGVIPPADLPAGPRGTDQAWHRGEVVLDMGLLGADLLRAGLLTAEEHARWLPALATARTEAFVARPERPAGRAARAP